MSYPIANEKNVKKGDLYIGVTRDHAGELIEVKEESFSFLNQQERTCTQRFEDKVKGVRGIILRKDPSNKRELEVVALMQETHRMLNTVE